MSVMLLVPLSISLWHRIDTLIWKNFSEERSSRGSDVPKSRFPVQMVLCFLNLRIPLFHMESIAPETFMTPANVSLKMV